jgi:hypothetical protein
MRHSRIMFTPGPRTACIPGLAVLLLFWTCVAQAATLTLAWNPSPQVDVAGYAVYWGNQPGVYDHGLDVGNQLSSQVAGLVDGQPYYFVVRAYNTSGLYSDPSVEVSRRVGIPHSIGGDFIGDHRSDMTVFEPSTGIWYSREIGTVSPSVVWGGGSEVPVPGDYDGDGKVDPAVYSPSTGQWWILYSSTRYATNSGPVSWGGGTGIPVPGDYDGDGVTDPAVYFPATGQWWILYSSTHHTTNSGPVSWGGGTGIPVPGDYDGDGQTDPAVFFPATGQWWILYSSTQYTTNSGPVQWGGGTDIPINGRH